MTTFSNNERDFLQKAKVGRMAQLGDDGAPRVITLCHAFVDNFIYIPTQATSWKTDQLRRFPQVSYVVDDYYEDWGKLCGVRVQGNVEILETGSEYQKAKDSLFDKYPAQFKEMGWSDGGSVVIKITATRVANWGL